MRILAPVLGLVVATAFGCGDEKRSSSGENEYVASFRTEAGLTFRSCGEIPTDCSEFDCGAECPDVRETTWRCIEEAFETCTPAHFRERVRYAPHAWSTDDVFVVPEDGACKVVRFQVVRAPEVDCHHVARWDCTSLRYMDMSEHEDWCMLWLDDCGEPTELEGEIGDCWL